MNLSPSSSSSLPARFPEHFHWPIHLCCLHWSYSISLPSNYLPFVSSLHFYLDYVASPRPKNPITKNFDPSHLYALPSKSTTRTNPTAICPTAEPSTSSTFANHHQPKISFLGERFKNSTHSSSQESNNSHSDHSGASGVTLPLDEPIEYADA